ncbi:MAG: DUF1801 domain-containing protein [Prolixibacteraceae bacterium]
MEHAQDVDDYIARFSDQTQILLRNLRQIIKNAAPESEEVISYQMPAYKLNGILVYFAGYKNHIGFYPGASGVEAFKTELTSYKCSKGTIQFALDQPIPENLVIRIVHHRIIENSVKAKKRTKQRP